MDTEGFARTWVGRTGGKASPGTMIRSRAAAWALAAAVFLFGIWPALAESAPTPTIRSIIFLNPGRSDIAAPAANPPVDLRRMPQLARSPLAAMMARFIGRPLTSATLAEIPPLAVAALRDAGWPSVRVSIPESDQKSGVVRVVVTVYVIHAIKVDGARYLTPAFFAAALGARVGGPLDPERLQAGLRRLNANDMRSADIDLVPAGEPGAIDVLVHAHDRLPLTLEAGYANSGPPSTGRDQYHFDITWNNVLGTLDDRLTYDFLTSNLQNRAPMVQGHVLGYEVDLNGIGTASLFAGYAFARVPDNGTASATGETIQVSPRFTRPLVETSRLRVSLQAGYDFKSIDNNILYGGTTATRSGSRISQFMLALLAARSDGWGWSDATLALYASPGGMMPGNDDASFRTLSTAARARYAYARLDLTRSTNLPLGLGWIMRGSAQDADIGLLPSEQLSAGGVGTVRGYPAYTLRGDAGMLLSNELRLADLHPLPGLGAWDMRVSPFLFVDYGAVHARDKTTALDGTLTSFGPGVRIGVGRHVDIVLDAGAQVRIESGRRYPGQFFDFAVTVRY